MIGFIQYVATAILTAVPIWVWIVAVVLSGFLVYRLLGLKASLAALGLAAVWIAMIFGEDKGRQFQIQKDTNDANKLDKLAADARARAVANAGGVQPPPYSKSDPNGYRD